MIDKQTEQFFGDFIEKLDKYYSMMTEEQKEKLHFILDQYEFYIVSEPSKRKAYLELAKRIKRFIDEEFKTTGRERT